MSPAPRGKKHPSNGGEGGDRGETDHVLGP